VSRIIAVRPADLGKFERALGAEFKRGQRATFAAFGRTASRTLSVWSAHIHDLGQFATGWTSRPRANGVDVYNQFSHAWWVEYGRGPGKQPPFDKIMPWVLRHISPPTRSVAFLIARKIGREGIRPRRVMTSAWGQAELARMWQTTMANFWAQALERAR
jgi:hypothetical protein